MAKETEMIRSNMPELFALYPACRRFVGAGVAAMLLSWAAAPVLAAPVLVINGDGNPESPFVSSDEGDGVTSGQTVGGLGAAQITFDTLNENLFYQSSGTRPLLGDNTIISAEIYVTATEVTVDDATAAQGEDRMKLRFRNPVNGDQEEVWLGPLGGGAGMGWFPTEVNTWTSFTYDLTQLDWWTDDYSAWEVYRVLLLENADDPYQNSFAIRNLQLTVPVPEPGSLALMGLGSLLIVARRRDR